MYSGTIPITTSRWRAMDRRLEDALDDYLDAHDDLRRTTKRAIATRISRFDAWCRRNDIQVTLGEGK